MRANCDWRIADPGGIDRQAVARQTLFFPCQFYSSHARLKYLKAGLPSIQLWKIMLHWCHRPENVCINMWRNHQTASISMSVLESPRQCNFSSYINFISEPSLPRWMLSEASLRIFFLGHEATRSTCPSTNLYVQGLTSCSHFFLLASSFHSASCTIIQLKHYF